MTNKWSVPGIQKKQEQKYILCHSTVWSSNIQVWDTFSNVQASVPVYFCSFFLFILVSFLHFPSFYFASFLPFIYQRTPSLAAKEGPATKRFKSKVLILPKGIIPERKNHHSWRSAVVFNMFTDVNVFTRFHDVIKYMPSLIVQESIYSPYQIDVFAGTFTAICYLQLSQESCFNSQANMFMYRGCNNKPMGR